jgi:hypothetical protein
LPGNGFGCDAGGGGAGVGRSGAAGERALARFGLITGVAPVFTACARAPLVGLLLARPALSTTGLVDTAHEVYREFGTG